jgi:pyruvate kinase
MTIVTTHPQTNPNNMSAKLETANKTKIVATLGPACVQSETLKSLAMAGVNVFRLNMSHGNIDEHLGRARMIRALALELDLPLAVLADLQGPKIRTGGLQDDAPVPLAAGEIVELTCRVTESSPGIVSTTFVELFSVLQPGERILLDDGKIHLQVIETTSNDSARCLVTQGGLLDSRKGINVPGAVLPIAALSDKDKADLAAAAKEGVDYVALSFVQRAADIRQVRELVASLGVECPRIIAKIEKPQALIDIEAILAEADGLMVARGDLGVELRPEEVPVAQKMLIAQARRAEKPIIVATQMLESMIHSLQPSRSDVSDIANAVFDGADAVMLSGETSVGEHPVATVAMMGRIIREAEKSIAQDLDRPVEESGITSPNFYHAIAHTASYACRKAKVRALVAFSKSGSMAQRLSKLKPSRPLIVLTPSRNVFNTMGLMWGVTPVIMESFNDTDEMLENCDKALLESGLLEQGDSILFCAGNTQMKNATNMLKLYHLGDNSI